MKKKILLDTIRGLIKNTIYAIETERNELCLLSDSLSDLDFNRLFDRLSHAKVVHELSADDLRIAIRTLIIIEGLGSDEDKEV
ncbi:hypothetical protein [Synergistes jonesii]|uniref:Uncharacterized protein n=1 Tax=Synergistes jonesii TaxID=2754 RepID=A0A073IUT1_9BACT|nr:hypothetical protein [Synergistes jonesii]KEJ93355.1 hypothetical protein EH55_08625 [Synergistes jonesii]OFB65110.1 hypothetical protein JS73_01130 [Synergistes jonesii]OFB65943.1 hypothetical protein JS72_00360 [Synergistes jonesii]OFB66383.1 hypothetical protein JS79_01140 [Synergistes jonesii]OFB69098.1 hypothetical protein JS78_01140 [Synergistes jonesii]